MYMGSLDGIISAFSASGEIFELEEGVRTFGGVPGALLVPEGVRLFTSTGDIESLTSPDGLNFGPPDPGLRVRSGGAPHPIELHYGAPYPFLMAYCTRTYTGQDAGTEDTPWSDVILTASSENAIDWNPILEPRILGSVPGVVELTGPPPVGGTLLLYYVDFWPEGKPHP
jgi:hypothetical protein